MEGYGQTENSAMATATWPGDYVGGHCGGPAVCTLLKLADVPDMGYSAVGSFYLLLSGIFSQKIKEKLCSKGLI